MKTTTDAANWRFHFTITDVARFLGKSPVTLRGWERKGLLVFPRESGTGDRRFTTDDIRVVAARAHELRRISGIRCRLVEAALTMIELIERENAS